MKRLVTFAFFTAAMSGCMVGPDYTLPITPVPTVFTEDREDETIAIEDDALIHWWTLFNDPFLDALLEETLDQNFDYRIAIEQVWQARAQYWQTFTQMLPEVDSALTGTRFRSSQAFNSGASLANASANASTSNAAAAAASPINPVQSFYLFGFDVIWQIDLFGKLRRSTEAAYDNWEAYCEDARAMKIVVLSEVINTYVIICAFQQKLDIASQVVSMDEDLLGLAMARFEAGLANEQEVDAALAALEADKANFKATETTLKQTIYSLALLLGRAPELIIADFQEKRPIPFAVGKIPLGLPADLLRRRPDIRAAERRLAVATEEIGVAVADLFPQLSLTGSSTSFAANPLQGANVGFTSPTFRKLFKSTSRIWGIGGFFTWPLLDFGKRYAAIDIQEDLRNQAYLGYQKAVIAALQETEEALVAYFNEQDREQELTKESEANGRIFSLTADLYQAGLVDYSQVLQAKEIWLASMNILIDSQQALATDLIAVYKALGGDW